MRTRNILLATLAFSACALLEARARAWTAFIDEATNYSQCGGTNLNEVTANLYTSLNNQGHPTLRYTNANAWPHDWIEACHPPDYPVHSYGNGDGEDYLYADGRSFSVFAGHGFFGSMWFGSPHAGMCDIQLGGMVRLGQMAWQNARAGTVWYLSSCTLNANYAVSDVNFQWVNQQAGFHDSPAITAGMVDVTYNYTWVNNKYAWLNVMDSYGNSPIVYSYGESAAIAQYVEDHASVAAGLYVQNGRPPGPSCGNGPPLAYYRWTMIDNGGC